MIGAVVGVQPFGGEGFSGNSPKAGGRTIYPASLWSGRLLITPLPLAAMRPCWRMWSRALCAQESGKQLTPPIIAIFIGVDPVLKSYRQSPCLSWLWQKQVVIASSSCNLMHPFQQGQF